MPQTDRLSSYINKFLTVLFYMALAVLGTCVSTLFLVRQYAPDYIRIMPGIGFAALGAALAVPVCALGKKSWIGTLAVLLAGAGYVRLTFNSTIGAAAYCFNAMVDEINDYYSSGLYYIALTRDMLRMADGRRLAGFVSFFTGYGYMYVLLKGKSTVVPIALVAVSYFLPATIENAPGFTVFTGAVIVVFCFLVKTGNRGGTAGKNDAAVVQAMLLMVLLTGAIISAVSFIRPRKGYAPSEALSNLNGRIVFSAVDIKNFFLDGNMPVKVGGSTADKGAAISAGELGRVGEIQYRNEPVFLVTAPKNAGQIYLKAYQGEVYTRRQWKNFDGRIYEDEKETFDAMENAGFSPYAETAEMVNYLALQGAEGVGFITYDMQVLQYTGDEYSYIPVNTIQADGQGIKELAKYDQTVHLDGDEQGAVNSVHSYRTMSWQRNTSLQTLADAGSAVRNGELGQYFDAKELYRRFVYEHYLTVDTPCGDRISGEVLPQIKSGEYSPQDGYGTVRFIEDTVNYFSRNYRYTLKPGTVPSDKDFVEYFLFETKQGFCTYFATAAVMIFRCAGIPARYAEGFVIPERLYRGEPLKWRRVTGTVSGDSLEENWDYYEIEVTDRYAHAWVEVYLDGIGWIIVDPTPGYTFYQGNAKDDEVLKETAAETESETETETEPQTEPERETQAHQENASGGIHKKPGIGMTGNQDKTSGQSIGEKLLFALKTFARALLGILKVAGIPAVVVLFFIFRQKYVEEKRNKLYNGNCGLSCKNRSELILKYFEKLLRRQGNGLYRNESYAEYFTRCGDSDTGTKRAAELMEKILYSDSEPTEKDIAELVEFVLGRRQEVYASASRFKKAVLKYIFIL